MNRQNEPLPSENGIFERYRFPVIAREHTPLHWRYDFDRDSNPFLMERIGVNCALNPGAIEFEGRIYMMVRWRVRTGSPFLAWLSARTASTSNTWIAPS